MIIGKIGPAFSAEEWINSDDPSAVNPIRHQGMTLRDYFAASFISSGTVFKNLSSGSTPDEVAAQAYALADAMLKARQA